MSLRSAIAAESASRDVQRHAHELEDQIRILEQQLGRLALASMAMHEILRDHLGVPAEVIEAKIQEIDLRDGKLDGTFRPPAKICKECGRVSGPTHATCIYCGTPLPKESSLIG